MVQGNTTGAKVGGERPPEFGSQPGFPLDTRKDGPDPAATLSKATTAPQTKRGTVSNDYSDHSEDELEAQASMDMLASSQTRRVA